MVTKSNNGFYNIHAWKMPSCLLNNLFLINKTPIATLEEEDLQISYRHGSRRRLEANKMSLYSYFQKIPNKRCRLKVI